MWDAFRRRASTIIEHAVGIATLLSLSIVLLVALWYTGISTYPDSEKLDYAYPINPVLWPRWVLGIVAALAFAGLLLVLWKVLDRVNPRVLLAVSVVLTSIIGIAWVSAQTTTVTLFADARNLVAYATGFVTGNTEYFAVGARNDLPMEDLLSYFRHYPYQAGMFFYYMGMFKLFGAGNIMALRYANVVANEIVLVCLYAIGRRLFTTSRARNALMVLAVLFIPFWLSSAFPYGNCIGFAFAATYVVCQIEAFVSKTPRNTILWAVGSLVPLAFGMSVKSTFVLLELAVIVAWIIRALRGKGIAGLAVSLAIFVAVNGITGAEVRVLERMLGTSVGEGMPKTSWILLGLTERQDSGQPGLWDLEAYEIYNMAVGDMDKQKQIVSQRLANAAANFAANPVYTVRFFAIKLAFEWAEPTYMSIYYSVLNSDANHTYFGYSEDGTFLYETPRKAFICVYDGYQTVVYALGAVGVLFMLKRLRNNALDARDVCMVLCLCFCAGFYCYLLWEAKGVYLLPFTVLLLPLSAYGLAGIASGVKSQS